MTGGAPKAPVVCPSIQAYGSVPSLASQKDHNQNRFPAVVKLFEHTAKYFPCTTRHTRFMSVEVLIKIVESYIYNSDYKQKYE